MPGIIQYDDVSLAADNIASDNSISETLKGI
jgi:hypothetical protein